VKIWVERETRDFQNRWTNNSFSTRAAPRQKLLLLVSFIMSSFLNLLSRKVIRLFQDGKNAKLSSIEDT
jgi:hypothetical protein